MATVKVRIAVVVNEDGSWGSCGYQSSDKRDFAEMMGIALDGLEAGKAERQYWLTAELDIPVADIVCAAVATVSDETQQERTG